MRAGVRSRDVLRTRNVRVRLYDVLRTLEPFNRGRSHFYLGRLRLRARRGFNFRCEEGFLSRNAPAIGCRAVTANGTQEAIIKSNGIFLSSRNGETSFCGNLNYVWASSWRLFGAYRVRPANASINA